jgi:hypothetical protein
MSTIPSLALIPSGVKASKVYSVLPTDGSGDFDFTRSGNATRLNSEGLIELVSTNVPRLNYALIDGVVSGCPSLLLEPQRINLLSYSETLSNWSNINNVTITDNSTISPDGSLNSSKINETADNNVHRLFINPTVSSAKHTYSVFLKAGTRKWAYLRLDGAITEQRTWFDLENGVIGTINSDHIASIENFGNGWYRCAVSIKGTTYDTTPLAILAIATGNDIISYAGDVNEYIYAWGAQLEAGSYPTSYIPTTTTTATRSAETCNNAGDASTFNDSEGVLFAEISALANDSFRFISLSDGSNNNNVRFNLSTTANQISFEVNSAASLKFTYTNNNTNFLLNNKVAIKYKQNDFNVFINGIKLNSSTGLNGGNFPIGLNTLNFDRGTGGNVFYGNTKQIQYYNTALNDSDLETLTSWDSFSDMATSQLYTIE